MFGNQYSDRTEMDEYKDIQEVLPEIDVRAGMARAMGKRHVYMQLLDKFRCRFADFSAVMQKHLAAQDKEAAIIQAHSLKGIAASLGAEELRAAARELEQQLRQGQTPAALPRVESLLEGVMQQLKGLDWSSSSAETASASTSAANAPVDAQPWNERLEQLLVPLHKLQVNRVKDQLHQLRQQSLNPSQSEQLEQLERMVGGYKYKQAAEFIEGLL